MLELHGWVTIRETPEASDEDNIRQIVDKLRLRSEKLRGIEIKAMNGEYYFEVSYYRNHRTACEVDELFDFLKYVVTLAPGSYGIVYMHDDEDESMYNEFQVFLPVRGEIKKRRDNYLSPFIPTVEDGGDDCERKEAAAASICESMEYPME